MKKSPFPGMDPFLERPTKWSSVHTRLADRLAPNFYVEIEERVTLTLAADVKERPQIEPDVYVVRAPHFTQTAIATTTATAQITAPPLVEAVYAEELRQRYLEIRDSAQREVVTTIELLSPFNKMSGERGRVDFLKKRERVMASDVHWIEIDLLRAGVRMAEVADKSDYYALLKRGGVLGLFEVWYMDIRDRLPTIAVPLRPPFDDAPLDLQAAFEDMYQRAHYAQSVDYTVEIPAPMLELSDLQWAKQRIAQWQGAQPSS